MSLDTGVGHFVMISTDKAVNPTSVMGASKRVAELLVYQASAQTGFPYVAVRFGNVLGSRGSVVPRFKEQIAAGGPVTVTHPDVERYFMTIPESVQLVLQAAAIGKGGEIFVLDMGDPIKIVDLAADLIQLSGYEVGRDIDIVFTSMRPGEKMKEELFPNGDAYQHTTLEKILIANNGNEKIPKNLIALVDQLEKAALRDDREEILRCLHLLAPEFQPKNQDYLVANIQSVSVQ
jgi:FlaA1/EpsC-like NDP-sugar epimerase